jgi:hypothetical protein
MRRNINNAIKKISKAPKVIDKSLIIGTAKHSLNYADWLHRTSRDNSMGQQRQNEFAELLGTCNKYLVGKKLGPVLTRQGKEWLTNAVYMPNGRERNTKLSARFSDEDKDAIKNFSHFTFGGFALDEYGTYQPVWRVHSKKRGKGFEYFFNGSSGFGPGEIEIYGLKEGDL